MAESHIRDTASACRLAYLGRYEASGGKKSLPGKQILNEYAQVKANTAENVKCD